MNFHFLLGRVDKNKYHCQLNSHVCMIPVCHHTVILFVLFYFCLLTAVLCPCPSIQVSMKFKCSSLNYIFFQQIFNVTIQRKYGMFYTLYTYFGIESLRLYNSESQKNNFDRIYKNPFIGVCLCTYTKKNVF